MKTVKTKALKPADIHVFNRAGRNKGWFVQFDPGVLDIHDKTLMALFSDIAVIRAGGLVEDFDNFQQVISPYLKVAGFKVTDPLSSVKDYRERSLILGLNPVADDSIKKYVSDRLQPGLTRVTAFFDANAMSKDDVIYAVPMINDEYRNAVPDTAFAEAKINGDLQAYMKPDEYKAFLSKIIDPETKLKSPVPFVRDNRTPLIEGENVVPITELAYMSATNGIVYATDKETGNVVEASVRVNRAGTTSRNVNLVVEDIVAKEATGERFVYSYKAFARNFRVSNESEIKSFLGQGERSPATLAEMIEDMRSTFTLDPVNIQIRSGPDESPIGIVKRTDFVTLAKIANKLPVLSKDALMSRDYLYLNEKDTAAHVGRIAKTTSPHTGEKMIAELDSDLEKTVPATYRLAMPYAEHWLTKGNHLPGAKIKYEGKDAVYRGRTGHGDLLAQVKDRDGNIVYLNEADVTAKVDDQYVMNNEVYTFLKRHPAQLGLTMIEIGGEIGLYENQSAYLKMSPPDNPTSIFCEGAECSDVAQEVRIESRDEVGENADIDEHDSNLCDVHSRVLRFEQIEMFADMEPMPTVDAQQKEAKEKRPSFA